MRRLSALRAAARIARRDARRARGRTALVAVLVGLPVFAGTAGGVLMQSTTPTDATYARHVLGEPSEGEEEVQARVESFTATDVEQSVRGDSFGHSDAPGAVPPTVAEHERALADVLPEGNRLLRVARAVAAFSTADRAVPSTDVASLPSDGDLSGVYPIDDGVLPAAADELALSPAAVERLGVGVGDAVTMDLGGKTRAMTVTGILEQVPTGPPVVTGPGAIAVPESASAGTDVSGSAPVTVEWYVTGPQPVSWNDVLAVNDVGSVVTSRAVLLDPPADHQVPGYHAEGPDYDAGALALVGGVVAVVFLEAVLLIGPAFAVGARRNERQLALLAASGAERRTLRHVVLLTGVMTGLAAAVVGAVAGLATAAAVRAVVALLGHPFVFADLRVPWLAVGGLAAFGTLAATVAAWIPSRRAGRVDVVAALAGRRPPGRRGRRLAIIGGVMAAAGTVAAVVGATVTEPIVLVAGVIGLELGVIAAAGALVGLTARLAPRLGAVGRLALRDAARNRSRTAPAVASIIAAVASITAGALYLQSGQDYNARQYAPFGAVGTIAVEVPTAELRSPQELTELLDVAATTLEEHLPVTQIHQVSLAVPAEQPEGAWIAARTPPENQCPLWGPDGDTVSREDRAAIARDGRCREGGGSGQLAWTSASGASTVVDDGTVVAALNFPGSERAAAMLADGRAVVGSDLLLRADGTVRVAVEHQEIGSEDVVAGPEVDLPAAAVHLPGVQYDLILPPEALDQLGLRSQPVGLVAAVSRPPTPAEEAAAAAGLGTDTVIHVERGNPFGRPSIELLLLVAAAIVVGLAATGISVALAAAESRPDLATLAAIGAEPRTRRRYTAAQAGVISGLGTTLGVLAGLALGWVLVTAQRYRWEIPDYDWALSIPWATVAGIMVGVPLLATTVGYLATRSQLPAARRIAA